MTFSMLGRDPTNGDLGVAVQSKFPGVGSLVPYGRADVGVVATQAFANPRHGSSGVALMRHGAPARQALEILVDADNDRRKRQFALLDRAGRTAAFTGGEVADWDGWAGSTHGTDCVAVGNGLAGPEVAEQMVQAFAMSPGSLAERLISALEAGQAAGGDLRGQQSAALTVLRKNGGYEGLDDRHVVISIYDHRRPIEELRRCYGLHRLSYFPSDPKNLTVVTPELAQELTTLMAARAAYGGAVDGTWDEAAQLAFARFLGAENYDNRIDNGGLVDLEVLADLHERYPADLPRTYPELSQ